MADPGVIMSMYLAFWFGMFNLAIGGYLVFFAERISRFLLSLAVVQALVGGGVYIIVRDPPWLARYILFSTEVLLPIVLALLLLFSILVTVAIFRAYELERPHTRLRRLASDEWEELSDWLDGIVQRLRNGNNDD